MSIASTGLGHDQRLVVRPERAKQMLDVGTTRLYDLINSGELKTFKDGKSRRILVSGIVDYIERKLGESEPKLRTPRRRGKAASAETR
jgi:hypothetical protein